MSVTANFRVEHGVGEALGRAGQDKSLIERRVAERVLLLETFLAAKAVVTRA